MTWIILSRNMSFVYSGSLLLYTVVIEFRSDFDRDQLSGSPFNSGGRQLPQVSIIGCPGTTIRCRDLQVGSPFGRKESPEPELRYEKNCYVNCKDQFPE